MNDDELHEYARSRAKLLIDLDKKQLRFNEIVEIAKKFYRLNVIEGINELIDSCDKNCKHLYIKNNPMWKSLSENYSWMLI